MLLYMTCVYDYIYLFIIHYNNNNYYATNSEKLNPVYLKIVAFARKRYALDIELDFNPLRSSIYK